MIDFTLTEEQQSMRQLAHDFAEKEIRPVAWDYDRDGIWPQAIIDKAWHVGSAGRSVMIARTLRTHALRAADIGFGAQVGLPC
ncbi:MAG: acyl-CoA dehydrogenase family protein, partial [Solirubrobacteraceae bacterium]